jgi:hypothetical protein
MTIPLASTAPTVDPPVMLTLVRWAPRMTAITPSVTLVKAQAASFRGSLIPPTTMTFP